MTPLSYVEARRKAGALRDAYWALQGLTSIS
jgi:hypothetical protein